MPALLTLSPLPPPPHSQEHKIPVRRQLYHVPGASQSAQAQRLEEEDQLRQHRILRIQVGCSRLIYYVNAASS